MARKKRKIFVLDTSVILHDFDSIYNFEEHDVAIPVTVLEEVDQFKKGNTINNFHAREFIRNMDKLSHTDLMQNWIPLNGSTHGKLKVLVDEESEPDAMKMFGGMKNDHRILNATMKLSQLEAKRSVVLVTKDINLRLKARAMNLYAEDYETGKIKDVDHLYSGKSEIIVSDSSIIDKIYTDGFVAVDEVLDFKPLCNQYFILKCDSNSALGFYNPRENRIERVTKDQSYGIKPRNAEQTFALHAIMNTDIQLVSISGSAGTGKTLLALAGALEQRREYRQIYLARPIVPLSNKDIGFLPGDIKSKINPYMQPLWDNLSFIKNQYSEKDKEFKKIDELVEQEKLHIVPLAYIRGRSISNIIFIVDEAQNLTPHEIKTIITRAGENTKIIFTGDVFQIDTPYLDSQSNGLSYLIDRVKDNPLYAHITLEKGERSDLANLGSKLL
ncbi:MAG TPA: ribonuclease [Bacteroidetes bacterium]|nr:ribonuclease [Bacteroidota bacterium]